MVSTEEWMFHHSLNQPQTQSIHTEEPRPEQDPLVTKSPPSQTNGVFMSKKKHRPFISHAVIGCRPYCSPEYSPDFHKLGSTLPRSRFGIMSNVKADTFIPLQASNITRVPYLEKKRQQDKLEEIQEVVQLEEWKPAAAIFTSVLEGLDTKAN